MQNSERYATIEENREGGRIMDEEKDLQTEEKPVFVPSPKWKRVLAWVLFVIVAIGIITWLLNIAYPDWIDTVKGWIL